MADDPNAPLGPLFADDDIQRSRSLGARPVLLDRERADPPTWEGAVRGLLSGLGADVSEPVPGPDGLYDSPLGGLFPKLADRRLTRSEWNAERSALAIASGLGDGGPSPRVSVVRRAGGRPPAGGHPPADAAPLAGDGPLAGDTPLAAPAVRGIGDRGGDLFDYRNLSQVPDVPQVGLDRYEPARGLPERIADLTSDPKVRRQMLKVIDEGERMGGREWYNTEPLRHSFLNQYGVEEGERQFKQFADLIAATSPRNPITSNVRTASYYHGLLNRGELLPDRPPAPYGSLAQNLHRQNVENLVERGGWDVMQNPKPASYSANIQGNQMPGTMDTHAVRLPALLSRDPRFLENSVRADNPAGGYLNLKPREMVANGEMTLDQARQRPGFWYSMPAKNEYGAMERFYQDLAQRRDMTTAQAQASAWVGGGETTGLASEPIPLLRIIENRIRHTAEQRGESPTEVLRKMIRGEAPLLNLGGLSATATLSALQALNEAGLSED